MRTTGTGAGNSDKKRDGERDWVRWNTRLVSVFVCHRPITFAEKIPAGHNYSQPLFIFVTIACRVRFYSADFSDEWLTGEDAGSGPELSTVGAQRGFLYGPARLAIGSA